MQDVTSKLKIQFDNGVTLRASFAQITQTRVTIQVPVTDHEGLMLYTIRRNVDNVEGFIAVIDVLNDVKNHLLKCDVNKFKGHGGMAVVKALLKSYDRAYRQARDQTAPIAA